MKPSPRVADCIKTSVDANLSKLLALYRHDIVPFFEGDPAINEPLHGFGVADAVLSNDIMIKDFGDYDHSAALSESFPCRCDVFEKHSRRETAIIIEQFPSPKFVPCKMHEITFQRGNQQFVSFITF